MQDQIIVELDKEVPCHYNGGVEGFNELVISAPNSKVQHHYMKLKGVFLAGLKESSKDSTDEASQDNNDEDAELEAKQFVMIMLLAGEKITAALDAFKLLVLARGASFMANSSGEVEMTSDIYDKLSMNDVETAMGQYLKAFIYPSII